MKAKINQDGLLNIYPENELEAYALNKWSDENFHLGNKLTENLTIHTRLKEEGEG